MPASVFTRMGDGRVVYMTKEQVMDDIQAIYDLGFFSYVDAGLHGSKNMLRYDLIISFNAKRRDRLCPAGTGKTEDQCAYTDELHQFSHKTIRLHKNNLIEF